MQAEQLMTGFDRITEDNEHLLRLQLWFYLNDSVTIMIFDTDHKLPTYLQNVIFSARQHAERAICYRKSVRLSVCLSVRPSVCHTGGSVKNG